MIAIIFLAVFLAGVVAGVMALLVLAIGREDRGDGLPAKAPNRMTAAARAVTGLRVCEPAALRSVASGRLG